MKELLSRKEEKMMEYVPIEECTWSKFARERERERNGG